MQAKDKTHALKNYLLQLANSRDILVTMTKLKILKLIYIAHGFCLAVLDEPLIDEVIEAWPYGPVVVSLYQDIAGEDGELSETDEEPDVYLSDAERQLVDNVFTRYGFKDAFELVDLTHKIGTPWKNVIDSLGVFNPISDQCIKDYYLNSHVQVF